MSDHHAIEELRARLKKRAFILDAAFFTIVAIGSILLVWGATTL